MEKVQFHFGSSISKTEEGYFVIIHHVKPVNTIKGVIPPEDVVVMGGPFKTEEEAKEKGSAILSEAMKKMNQMGLRSHRPRKN